MPYVVVEIDDTGAAGRRVNTYGPYETHHGAEQARRRRHRDNLGRLGYLMADRRKTYVSQLEPGSF